MPPVEEIIRVWEKPLHREWILCHEPHGLITFESRIDLGFLCLPCEIGSVAPSSYFRFIPEAFDLYMALLKREDEMLVKKLASRLLG